MAEYIDREAVLTEIYQYTRHYWPTVSYVESIIKEQPAADVEPVRHGRWIVPMPPDNYTYCKCVCSECKRTAGKHKTLYCPNCGAKMG